jgi:hypothetical protein
VPNERGGAEHLARQARLLAVVGSHLEPDPGPEGAEHGDAGRSRAEHDEGGMIVEQLERVQRRRAQAVVAAADEDGDGEDERAHDLGHEEDAEDPRGDLDVKPREQQIHPEHAEHQRPHRDAHVQPAVNGGVGEVAEHADDRRGEDRVRRGHHRRRADAQRLAEAVGDERVEASHGGDATAPPALPG